MWYRVRFIAILVLVTLGPPLCGQDEPELVLVSQVLVTPDGQSIELDLETEAELDWPQLLDKLEMEGRLVGNGGAVAGGGTVETFDPPETDRGPPPDGKFWWRTLDPVPVEDDGTSDPVAPGEGGPGTAEHVAEKQGAEADPENEQRKQVLVVDGESVEIDLETEGDLDATELLDKLEREGRLVGNDGWVDVEGSGVEKQFPVESDGTPPPDGEFPRRDLEDIPVEADGTSDPVAPGAGGPRTAEQVAETQAVEADPDDESEGEIRLDSLSLVLVTVDGQFIELDVETESGLDEEELLDKLEREGRLVRNGGWVRVEGSETVETFDPPETDRGPPPDGKFWWRTLDPVSVEAGGTSDPVAPGAGGPRTAEQVAETQAVEADPDDEIVEESRSQVLVTNGESVELDVETEGNLDATELLDKLETEGRLAGNGGWVDVEGSGVEKQFPVESDRTPPPDGEFPRRELEDIPVEAGGTSDRLAPGQGTMMTNSGNFRFERNSAYEEGILGLGTSTLSSIDLDSATLWSFDLSSVTLGAVAPVAVDVKNTEGASQSEYMLLTGADDTAMARFGVFWRETSGRGDHQQLRPGISLSSDYFDVGLFAHSDLAEVNPLYVLGTASYEGTVVARSQRAFGADRDGMSHRGTLALDATFQGSLSTQLSVEMVLNSRSGDDDMTTFIMQGRLSDARDTVGNSGVVREVRDPRFTLDLGTLAELSVKFVASAADAPANPADRDPYVVPSGVIGSFWINDEEDMGIEWVGAFGAHLVP